MVPSRSAQVWAVAGGDVAELSLGRIGLAVGAVAPADDGVVCSQPARVGPTGGHVTELAGGRVQPAADVGAPAFDRAAA